MLETIRTTGIVLYFEELFELAELFEDGTFAQAILDASDKPQRFRLCKSHITKTSVVLRKVPVYGVMVTFWKLDHFIQIGIKRVLRLMSFLDIRLRERQARPKYQRQNGIVEDRLEDSDEDEVG